MDGNAHFGYTAEALGEVDIKSLYKKATSAQNYNINEEDIKYIYPIICTDCDLDNDNFLNGMGKYSQFQNHQTTPQELYSDLQSCMESFWKAGEEGIHYGYTNWITLFFIGHDNICAMKNDMEGNGSILSRSEFLDRNLPSLNQALLILKRDDRYTAPEWQTSGHLSSSGPPQHNHRHQRNTGHP